MYTYFLIKKVSSGQRHSVHFPMGHFCIRSSVNVPGIAPGENSLYQVVFSLFTWCH